MRIEIPSKCHFASWVGLGRQGLTPENSGRLEEQPHTIKGKIQKVRQLKRSIHEPAGPKVMAKVISLCLFFIPGPQTSTVAIRMSGDGS